MKKRIKTKLLNFVVALCALLISADLPAQDKQDKFLNILKDELKYDMEQLKTTDNVPYYMNFRASELTNHSVTSSFGVLDGSIKRTSRIVVPQIRIGSYEFDNMHNSTMGAPGRSFGLLPVGDNNELAIRQAIWNEVDARYQYAISAYDKLKADQKVSAASDDKAPDFSDIEIENYYEAPFTAEELAFDTPLFEAKVKKYSALFNDNKYMLSGSASIQFNAVRRYFVSSEGSEVVENRRYCRLMISAMVKADDGMELPLYLSYFAFSPKDLPADEVIIADTKQLISTLDKMRVAPVVEPYTGPAMLSGEASGVFFHEIFGHRIEGQRMKSDSDGQTFKKMIGQMVLPEHFSVYDDPTVKQMAGTDLNGYFIFDDQGVRGKKVDVVKDGKLNEFLMTRVPTDEFGKSNGHARADYYMDPVSRQSNLIIETSKHLSDAELRKLFIEEIKAQNKEFGYFFKEVSGGFTMTGRMAANSFNVTPLEVYKVYIDGREDELVRGVDLIGTPLSMFSGIMEAGGTVEVFTGMCGAESGSVPVTGISPSVFVKKVEMQRKGKSRNTPPILERP